MTETEIEEFFSKLAEIEGNQELLLVCENIEKELRRKAENSSFTFDKRDFFDAARFIGQAILRIELSNGVNRS